MLNTAPVMYALGIRLELSAPSRCRINIDDHFMTLLLLRLFYRDLRSCIDLHLVREWLIQDVVRFLFGCGHTSTDVGTVNVLQSSDI
jgi:hypothetical protein